MDIGTLQLARIKITTNASGYGSHALKVPGTAGDMSSRLIIGGQGWSDNYHADDVVKICLTDEDNILGYGAGSVIKAYTDLGVPSGNQGWFTPKGEPLDLDSFSGIGSLLAGLYLKIEVQKGDNSIDIFRCNIKWSDSKV